MIDSAALLGAVLSSGMKRGSTMVYQRVVRGQDLGLHLCYREGLELLSKEGR